jgi:plastocyanin domain-containing protein
MKRLITIIAVILVPIIGIVILTNQGSNKTTNSKSAEQANASSNVSIEDGKQIIEIKAKGGYAPRITTAKANLPTILRVVTNGTFDCSSSLRIPALNYSQNLPPSGTTDIEVSAQPNGSTLKALCSMGMYNFSIQFKG